MGASGSKSGHPDNPSKNVSDTPGRSHVGGDGDGKRAPSSTQISSGPQPSSEKRSTTNGRKIGKGKTARKKNRANAKSRHVGGRKKDQGWTSAPDGDEVKLPAVQVPSGSAGRGACAVGGGDHGAEGCGDRRKGHGRKTLPSQAITRSAKNAKAGKDESARAAAAAPADADVLACEALFPFLRSEGWNRAEGKGFHTWFHVSPPEGQGTRAEGRKRVSFLVSEEEVVKYVRDDEQVLARYEAFCRGSAPIPSAVHSTAAAQTVTDSMFPTRGDGSVEAVAGTAAARNCENNSGDQKCRRTRRASSPDASTHDERNAKDETSTTRAPAESNARKFVNSDVAGVSGHPAPSQAVTGHDVGQRYLRANKWRRIETTARQELSASEARSGRKGSPIAGLRQPHAAVPGAASVQADSSPRQKNPKGGGGKLRVDSPAVTRGRSKCTGSRAVASWREIWPKLREEGWNWDYGNTLATSAVYLKPGASKDSGVLGVTMFDSKDSVLNHVAASSSACAAAATPPAETYMSRAVDICSGGDDAEVEVVEGARSATAWSTRAANDKPSRPAGLRYNPSAGAAHPKRENASSSTEPPTGGVALYPLNKRTRVGRAGQQPGGVMGFGTNREQRRVRTDGVRARDDDTGADSGDEIELAAAVVVEMLRGEKGDSSEGRRTAEQTATQRLGAARRRGAGDVLTAHCCEQMIALSESGRGCVGVGAFGPRAPVWSGDGGDVGRFGGEARSTGAGASGLRHPSWKRQATVGTPSSSPHKNDSSGGSAEMKNPGFTLLPASGATPSRLSLFGPLFGVGVIVASPAGVAREEIEAGIRRLGGEVVEIFAENAASDGWRKWLLREPGRQGVASGDFGGRSGVSERCGDGGGAKGKSPSSAREGKGTAFDGSSRTDSSRRMMAVASPGSERTPDFQLAIAAGIPIVHPSYLSACVNSATEVEPLEYLLPLGRSALGNRPVIMPSRSRLRRPFQGKLVVLCMDKPAHDEKSPLDAWRFIFSASGAVVKVVQVSSSGSGSGGCTSQDGTDESRRTPEDAVRLLQEGRVDCVIGCGRIPNGSVPAASGVMASAVSGSRAAASGKSESDGTGSADTGLAVTESGVTGSGVTGSGETGSGEVGSGEMGSGVAGSAVTGLVVTESGVTESGVTGSAVTGSAVTASVVEKMAVATGTLAGSLEWALQCMAHGRLLLPTAEACPWFTMGGVGGGRRTG